MKRGSKESRRDQKPSNFREIRDIFCFGMRIYEQLSRFTLIQQKSLKKYRPITKKLQKSNVLFFFSVTLGRDRERKGEVRESRQGKQLKGGGRNREERRSHQI